MQLINVIPIARSIGMESLTYFSLKPLKEGLVVFVPLRKKEVPAIVLSSQDITDMKTQIRSAGFALKKIENKKTQMLLLPEFVSATRITADYFATTTGAILHSTVPSAIWNDIGKAKTSSAKGAVKKELTSRRMILQSEINDRFGSYKSLVREEFAKKSSVFLLVPTIQDAEKAKGFLQKGVENYTFVLHSKLSKKEILTRWKNALKSEHPVLIIATGSFLSIPRLDLSTIIIERENSRSYKQFNRPFMDMRILAENLAKERKIRIIFGDLPLSIDTMWRYKENELDELSPPRLRTLREASQTLVDMKDKKHQKAGKFEAVSNELKALVSNTIETNKNMFVFTARRGLAPSTTCRDCGSPVLCHECEAPIVLHGTSKGNRFICHACGASRSADERCKGCASWKLQTLGIGVQLVEKILKEEFPKAEIFVIDKDTASTHKKASALIEKFYATKGAVLIGTEMALAYLDKPIENSAIATMDSLFSLPEWRMSEKILSLLLKIKETTKSEMLIQTRKPDQKIFDFINKGNLVDFYKEEIKKRKQFDYPPFSIFIKVSVVGTPERVSKEMEYLKKLLSKYDIQVYPSSIKVARGKFAMHGLLRVERRDWPNKEIVEILRSLPPHFSIDVDPESLL
ncbi:primosomal protein N' [bacterium]|nr:primosomal protein N' [bacterium]MBT4894833.1 primosomal protein N' [bacterium]